jgi:multiple sugar transport system substrate-binding protein
MRNKLFAAIAILMVLSLVLAGCADTVEPTVPPTAEAVPATEAPSAVPPTAAPPAGEPVTIKMMVVDYIPDKTDTWLEEEVVPAFQKEYPNVTVEFVYVNWGTLDETIQGYFAAGEGADILNLGSEYIAEYGDRLAKLNSYMDEWGELENFVPATLDTVTWDGEVRGLPWLTAPRAIMCRMDILGEAGITAPPATFADALKVAKDTTKIENNALVRQGYIGGVGLNDWQEYVDLIWSLGAGIYKDDGSPNFDSPEAKAALQFMYDRRKAILPEETIAGLPEATGSRLATGEVGCQWSNLWGAPPTSDAIWDQIELSPGINDPTNFPNSKPVVQVFNDWLAVAGYSKHLPEAVAFLQFLGSKENLNKYNADFGSFPPRKDAWTGFVEDPIMQQMGGLMEEYGMGFADVRETAQFRDILVAEMDAFFADLQDIDTTMANIQEKYTQVLVDAGRLP